MQLWPTCFSVTGSCGGSSNENNTYFESSGTDSGTCAYEICKCQKNICQVMRRYFPVSKFVIFLTQIRLDFMQFTIAGPTVTTETEVNILNGQVGAGGVAANTNSQCNTDTFSVTNPGGQTPPTICGQNSNEHSRF